MVYLDLIFLLNFIYDFLLLMTVNIALKRVTKLRKIFISSLFGSLFSFVIFLDLNNIMLIIFKIISAFVMCLIAFEYRNILYTITNITYLYMSSIILAGFMYYLSMQISSDNLINLIIIISVSPLILLAYILQAKKLKNVQNLSYKVKIVFKNNKNLILDGFIDSGNKLKDPVTNKYVIIVDKKVYHNKNPIYVPFKGVNKTGLLECFTLKYIEVNNKKFNNYLLGVSNEIINLDGSNCILNYKLMEELNV